MQARALILVVEDSQVRHPRIGAHLAKSLRAVEANDSQHRGLVIQLDSDQQRRVWHVIYQQPKPGKSSTKPGVAADEGQSPHGTALGGVGGAACASAGSESANEKADTEDKTTKGQADDEVPGDDVGGRDAAREASGGDGDPRGQGDVEMGGADPGDKGAADRTHGADAAAADATVPADSGSSASVLGGCKGPGTMCLRELDLHKCAIMPPVINAT
jgi:hypothetical protein